MPKFINRLPDIPMLLMSPISSRNARLFELCNLSHTLTIHLLVLMMQPQTQNNTNHKHQQAERRRDPQPRPK